MFIIIQYSRELLVQFSTNSIKKGTKVLYYSPTYCPNLDKSIFVFVLITIIWVLITNENNHKVTGG